MPTFLRSGKNGGISAPASPIVVTVTGNAGEQAVAVVCFGFAAAGAQPVPTFPAGWTKQGTTSLFTGVTRHSVETWTNNQTGFASVSVAFNNAPDSVAIGIGLYSGVTAIGNATGTTVSAATSFPITLNMAAGGSTLVAGWAGDDASTPDPYSAGASTNLRDQLAESSGAADTNMGFADRAGGPGNLIAALTVAAAACNVAIQAVELKGGGPVVGFGANRGAPGKGPRDKRGFLKARVWDYTLMAVAAAAVSVNPGQGAIQIDGFAPTVTASNNQAVAPNVGSLTLTGFAPTVSTPVAVLPGSGALTITGFAPSVVVNSVVNPNVGQLVLTGFAPTVATPVSVLPATGQLSLTGFAPTVAIGTNVNPGAGQLSLDGFAPTVVATNNQSVTAGLGQLTITGFAPTVFASNSQNVTAGQGSLVLTGFAPTVTTAGGDTPVAPAVGQLVLTGFAPTVTTSGIPDVAHTVSGGKAIHREGVGRSSQGFLPGVDPASYVLLDDKLSELRKSRTDKATKAEQARLEAQKEADMLAFFAAWLSMADDEDV